jgi:hypothetical protein
MSKKFSITIIEAPDQNQRENPNNQFSNNEPMTFAQKVEYVKSIEMTNNKQQTAVDILCGKLAMKLGIPQAITFYIDHQEEIKEAKEMEKQRIETAYNKGTVHGIDYPESTLPITGEQYYEQTYGGGEQ